MKKFNFLVFAALAVLIVGCTSERQASFPDGDGESLLEVSAYDGKKFEIKTLNAIAAGKPNFSNAQKLQLESQKNGLANFQIVNYEVNDMVAKELLSDTAIIGKSNHTYGGLIKLNEKYLIVYKVGTKATLPLTEQDSALKLENDLLAVPLVGYPLAGKYTIERRKDDNNQTTSKLREKSQDKLAGATHFRLSLAGRRLFEPALKTDLFPVAFFEGEWFFNRTVISAPEDNSDSLGFTSNSDSSLKDSPRIKFIHSDSALTAVNVNLDPRLLESTNKNFTKTLTIPVRWIQHRINDQGQGLGEEVNDEVHWSERQFVQLEINKIEATGVEGNKLVGFQVTDNYFSFVVENPQNIRIKYTFMRTEQSTYKPKRMFLSDFKKFGYFTTMRDYVDNFEIHRREDIEKNVFVSRFNPERDEIVYHFSTITPEWIRPAVRQSINAWQDAFKEAGSKIQIKLNESFDVELGDIRYNVINILEPLAGNSNFGYGPSLQNPLTGEIITATTNVNLTSIRENIIDGVRDYISLKRGEFSQSIIVGISAQIRAIGNIITNKNGESSKVVSQLFNKEISWSRYVSEGNSFAKKEVLSFAKSNNPEKVIGDFSFSAKFMNEEIPQLCPEVTAFIERNKGRRIENSEEENQVLDTCSRKLVVTRFQTTLVHELGHNFGLRHNFMGSIDKANFWDKSKTQTKEQVGSSSVMDYFAFDAKRSNIPGRYDIAAIRFGYSDAVTLDDEKTVIKLDTKKSIDDNMKAMGLVSRKYKFCTDEHTSLSTSALCDRWDQGTTPLEIVQNTIAEYNSLVEKTLQRGDRKGSPNPERLLSYKIQGMFVRMMRIYEEWRLGILKYTGPEDKYLERYDEKSFDELIKKMAASPKFKDHVALYKPAVDQIFQFFMTVLNTENRYCVVVNKKTESVELKELSSLRTLVHARSGAPVASCEDAREFLEGGGTSNEDRLSNDEYVLMADIGNEIDSHRNSLSTDQSLLPFGFSKREGSILAPDDGIGFMLDRVISSTMLTTRLGLSYEATLNNFGPSMLDEPRLRRVYFNIAMDRIINGINGGRLVPLINSRLVQPLDQNTIKIFKETYFGKFVFEKDIIANTLLNGLQSIVVPTNLDTLSRLDQFRVQVIRQVERSVLEKALVAVQLPNGLIVAVFDENAIYAKAMLEKFQEIQKLKSAAPIDLKDTNVKGVYDQLKAYYPAKKDLGTRTVAQLLELEKLLGELIPKFGEKNVVAFDFLVTEFQLIGQLKKVIETNIPAEEREAFLKRSINEFLKEMGAPELANSKESIDEFIAAKAQTVEYYQKNKAELDAQSDLLIRIISFIAGI